MRRVLKQQSHPCSLAGRFRRVNAHTITQGVTSQQAQQQVPAMQDIAAVQAAKLRECPQIAPACRLEASQHQTERAHVSQPHQDMMTCSCSYARQSAAPGPKAGSGAVEFCNQLGKQLAGACSSVRLPQLSRRSSVGVHPCCAAQGWAPKADLDLVRTVQAQQKGLIRPPCQLLAGRNSMAIQTDPGITLD